MPTAARGRVLPCRSLLTTRGRSRSPKSPALEPLRPLASRSSQPRLGGKAANTVSCAPADATNRQIIERGNRIGLRPQAHSTGLESRVAVVEKQRTIEPTLDVVTDRDHPEQMPLTESGRLDAGASELTAPVVIGIEPEVVLKRVGSHHIVCVVAEPKHDAARASSFPDSGSNFT